MARRSLFLTAALMLALLLAVVQAQTAQAYVYETTHDATCSSFTLNGTTSAPNVTVHVVNAQTNTTLYLGIVPANNGSFTANVTFEAQPAGSILYYFAWGNPSSTDPWASDGEFSYELNDGYPCSQEATLSAAATSWTNGCNTFAATGITNAPYVGVQVKDSKGTTLYIGKFPSSAGNFAFNAGFVKQKTGSILEYRIWPSTTSTVTARDGSYGYYFKGRCKA